MSCLGISNLERKLEKVLFLYVFIWVGKFSYVGLWGNKDIVVKEI